MILRVAARLEGKEFYVAEATEIAFDEEFSERTFRLELPSVEFSGWIAEHKQTSENPNLLGTSVNRISEGVRVL